MSNDIDILSGAAYLETLMSTGVSATAVAAAFADPEMQKGLRALIAFGKRGDKFASLERAASLVSTADEWMCNEHIRRFRFFLRAYYAYKADKPLENEGRKPGFGAMLADWFNA